MKYVLALLLVVGGGMHLKQAHAEVRMCNWNDKRCIQAQERSIAIDEDIAAHRRWMQGHIDVAVERQKEAEAIINSQPKFNVKEFVAEACRQDAIQATLQQYGHINSAYYSKRYGQCLRENGLSYD